MPLIDERNTENRDAVYVGPASPVTRDAHLPSSKKWDRDGHLI